MDTLLLPALIGLVFLAMAALAAAEESRDGFAIHDERPLAHH